MTTGKNNRKRLAANIAGLLLVFCLMGGAALLTGGSLLGHRISHQHTVNQAPDSTASGVTVINTTEAGKDIAGYGGAVPLEIYLTDGRIDSVRALPNRETPRFFRRVVEAGLLDSWNGITPAEAVAKEVDAVSGATYSSEAVKGNVRAGLAALADAEPDTRPSDSHHTVAFFISLIVLLGASVLPLVYRNKYYRTVQLIMNTAVLGFWSGTFLNYTMMLRICAEGITFGAASMVPLVLLIVAFIYPLCGHPGHYCAWVCPLGSLQELALKCNPHHRVKVSAKAGRALVWVRRILWIVLMVCLYTGFFTSWIDYELFTAFMVREAATGVLIAGGAVLLLSVFVPRPYCNWVCPTGTLIRLPHSLSARVKK